MLLAAVDFDNLHQVLRVLYDEMMPLCGNMTGVAKGIAGLGALFYVEMCIRDSARAVRVTTGKPTFRKWNWQTDSPCT